MNIRATHPDGFRSGEWAEVEGLEFISGRPCFVVRFIDGTRDDWPIYDPADPYEFRPKTMFQGVTTYGHTRAERERAR